MTLQVGKVYIDGHNTLVSIVRERGGFGVGRFVGKSEDGIEIPYSITGKNGVSELELKPYRWYHDIFMNKKYREFLKFDT